MILSSVPPPFSTTEYATTCKTCANQCLFIRCVGTLVTATWKLRQLTSVYILFTTGNNSLQSHHTHTHTHTHTHSHIHTHRVCEPEERPGEENDQPYTVCVLGGAVVEHTTDCAVGETATRRDGEGGQINVESERGR